MPFLLLGSKLRNNKIVLGIQVLGISIQTTQFTEATYGIVVEGYE
jgi:hypothetical protein